MSHTPVPPSITPYASDVRLVMARREMSLAHSTAALAAAKDKAKASGLTPTDLERLKALYDNHKQRLRTAATSEQQP